MNVFISPNGNREVWAEMPEGYFTEEAWRKANPDTHYEMPFDEARKFGREAVQEQRDTVIRQGFVEYVGARHSTSEKSQRNISNLLSTISESYETGDWKCRDAEDNEIWIFVTAEDVRNISRLVLDFVERCRAEERSRIEIMDGMTTARELLDWLESGALETGWPA